MYRNNLNNEPPVEEGEELEVKIESIGDKGDGVAKVKGFVIFVPNVEKGDLVKIKITKVLSKMGFAEVLEKKKSEEEELDEILEDDSDMSEDFGEELE